MINYFFNNITHDCWERITNTEEYKRLSKDDQKQMESYFTTLLTCNRAMAYLVAK